MREFTDKEKYIVTKLIELHHINYTLRLGEALLHIFPAIKGFEPTPNKNDEFYRHTIKFYYDEKHVTQSDVLDAIYVIDLLINKNYLIVKEFFSENIIGERPEPMTPVDGVHYTETSLLNYFPFDLWKLLSSSYYVTNALKDFAKDFKTIEQRRHDKQIEEAEKQIKEAERQTEEAKKQIKEAKKQRKIALKAAKTSAEAAITAQNSYKIAIVALAVTVIFNVIGFCSPQKIKEEQINQIENAIKSNHITEPLKVGFGDSIAIKPLEVKVHLDAPQNNSSTQK